MDLPFAERLAKTFGETYPGITVRVERSGAERVFTRIGQEYSSNIHAVDVVNTSDQAHCIVWKRSGWLAPYLPEEVAKHFDPKYYDPDGMHVTTRVLISPIGYNTNLVKKEEAEGFTSEMGGQRDGRAHKALQRHDRNSTFQTAREWAGALAKLPTADHAVQSATDTPRRSRSANAVMVDGAAIWSSATRKNQRSRSLSEEGRRSPPRPARCSAAPNQARCSS
jgi:iron(III) transport system substrate-binding protein